MLASGVWALAWLKKERKKVTNKVAKKSGKPQRCNSKALLTFPRPFQDLLDFKQKKINVGICLKRHRSQGMAKVTSHAIHDAILYILHIHIVHQTTPCVPSSNMRTLSYIMLLQYAFRQACPGMHASCWVLLCYKHLAGSCSAIRIWLNAVHQASIWLNAVH